MSTWGEYSSVVEITPTYEYDVLKGKLDQILDLLDSDEILGDIAMAAGMITKTQRDWLQT